MASLLTTKKNTEFENNRFIETFYSKLSNDISPPRTRHFYRQT